MFILGKRRKVKSALNIGTTAKQIGFALLEKDQAGKNRKTKNKQEIELINIRSNVSILSGASVNTGKTPSPVLSD